MGNIIVRKDNTSIFCLGARTSKQRSKWQKKVAEMTLAVSLMISGLIILFFAS
jgi:hypothetical protein